MERGRRLCAPTDLQRVYAVGSTLPGETGDRDGVLAGLGEVVRQPRLRRQTRKMQWFVVQSDSIEAIGIEPASGALINRDSRVESRCSRLSFERPRFVRGHVEPEFVDFAWLAQDAAYHGGAVQVCGRAFVLNLL